MLYSKNGSIPQSLQNLLSSVQKLHDLPEASANWQEVSEKPECPEGKEVVWWYPPGWVIRDPKPADEEGFVWKWNQSTEEWIKYSLNNTES